MLVAGLVLTGCGKDANQTLLTEEVETSEQTQSETEASVSESETVTETSGESEATEASEESKDEQSDIFEMFFNDKVTATVGDGIDKDYIDISTTNAGQKLTFSELMKVISSAAPEELRSDPQVSYKIVNIGGNDVLFLNVTGVKIYGSEDMGGIYYVVAKDGDALKLTYGAAYWARNSVVVTDQGVIFSSGSSGAGDHVSTTGFIDENGNYVAISVSENCYPGWIGSMFEYFEPSFFSDNTKSLAYKVDENYSMEDGITLSKIGDKLYCVFSNEGDSAVSDLKQSAEADGVIAVTYEEFEKAEKEYAQSHGVSQEALSAEEIQWIER